MAEFLTREEVEELPDGTEVEVVWSGGNGPHHYRIVRTDWGVAVDNIYQDILDFVGPEPPFTTVKLISGPEARGE